MDSYKSSSSSSSCRATSMYIPHSLSLATPHLSSLPAGPQGYTLYPNKVAVCGFELAALILHGYVKGSIGVHHL